MKVGYEFDPFELAGVEPPESPRKRRQALKEIGEYVKGEILDYVADGTSPVSGGKWKRSLSPEYRKRKAEISGVTYANMELSGDMLDALEYVITGDTELEIKIDGDEGDKADGHNNHSGNSELPAREFIPKPNQTFKRDIIRGIREIAEEFAEDQD